MADYRTTPIPEHQPYSAAQERHEKGNGVDYVIGYIRQKHYAVRIGTGNAFGAQAQDPMLFADKVRSEDFYSWDYISAGEILEADRVTPNANFERVRRAMQSVIGILRANYARKA